MGIPTAVWFDRGREASGGFVRFNSSRVIAKYVVFFPLPLYTWSPILIMLVFNSEPLPNALLYGMGEYHNFKNSKYCSVSLIMGRHYSKQFTFISSSPHNSPVRYVLLISLLYR